MFKQRLVRATNRYTRGRGEDVNGIVSGGATGDVAYREGDGLTAPLVPQPVDVLRVVVIHDMDNRCLSSGLPGVS